LKRGFIHERFLTLHTQQEIKCSNQELKQKFRG
jgi:hypothetical protein